ncbi:MAG: response regulator [Bacteroidetes bacterium]|nr:response regulator [Bacteroidota bacterium]MBT6685638.1 response regulator [Bacteroidota bacterium]MBT7141862.1 response regulator [Bacteroidota bacterium]MBT7491061.1 response regulator [Bacteroidota bacterium]
MPPKILIVEDNIANQILMIEHLKYFQAKVEIANNGLEALEMVKNQSFDIVLMDLNMPVLSGFEATKKIREIYCKEYLPIIAVTGNSSNNEEKICLEIGMNAFVKKPYSAKKIVCEIEKLLNIFV